MSHTVYWFTLGFTGQLLYSARFGLQWIASERARKSVVPRAFWWLSLAGGTILFVYAVGRGDPVIALGQGFGLVVYARNLWLLGNGQRPVASIISADPVS